MTLFNLTEQNTAKPLSGYKPLVPAVQQAAQILLELGKSEKSRMTLTEICQGVGIHKSKGYSILNTLKNFGLIEKDDATKTYSLGPSIIFLSRKILDRLYYPDVVAPFLENLARETMATAVFGMITGNHVYVISKYEGNQKLGFSIGLGHRFHITLGAHGKAILASMPEREQKKILLGKKLYFYGENNQPDLETLRADLEEYRRCGFAWDAGLVTPGVNVVSSVVRDLREKIVGCIILVGTFPEAKIQDYGAKVAACARHISWKLGGDLEQISSKQAKIE